MLIAPVALTLRHLNPLLVNLPPISVVLEEAVAKNGQVPPSD